MANGRSGEASEGADWTVQEQVYDGVAGERMLTYCVTGSLVEAGIPAGAANAANVFFMSPNVAMRVPVASRVSSTHSRGEHAGGKFVFMS